MSKSKNSPQKTEERLASTKVKPPRDLSPANVRVSIESYDSSLVKGSKIKK